MPVTDWYQQHLTPPAVTEVNVRYGVIPDADHVQALVEVKDPTTGVLVGQWSYPHATMRDLQTVLDWVTRRAKEAIEGVVEPF